MLPAAVPVDPQTTGPREGDMGRGQARGMGFTWDSVWPARA